MGNQDNIASEKTIEAARSLWEDAVTIDTPPDRTIKSSESLPPSSDSMRAHPRSCEIRKGGEETPELSRIDFELGKLIGRGGMGVVYTARQASLDREIAVKMMDSGAAENPDSVNKFLSEAVVTGNLDHPNIVPVYDVGDTPDGTIFYAMKEVAGTSWNASIEDLSLNENLRILLSVCDAVAFAHDKGIVHRDLKPENVMLGDYGEILVMDWGLALRVAQKSNAPSASDSGLAGTPSYMAPEMANCDLEKVSFASDVYLLGGILYEIVTGLKPHSGIHVFATISAAMENAIEPTDRKGELVDIALKAMATRPEDRYGSVKDFQRAVREYQEHAESLSISRSCTARLDRLESADRESEYREANEIIAGYQQALQLWSGNRAAIEGLCTARSAYAGIALNRGDLTLAGSQLSALEAECEQYHCREDVATSIVDLRQKLSLAAARARAKERLIRISVAIAVIVALAAIGITAAAYAVTRKQRDAALQAKLSESLQRERAQSALRAAEEANYYNIIALADRHISQAHPGEAEALLFRTPPALRGWEWGALAYQSRRSLLTIRGNFPAIFCTAFDPAGEIILTVDIGNNVAVWNSWTGENIASVLPGIDGIFTAAFEPSGATVLVMGHDGHLRRWNLKEARELSLARLESFRRDLIAVAISADSRHAAGLARNGECLIWRTSTAGLVSQSQLQESMDSVNCMAISDDLKQTATGSNDGAITVYDSASGTVRRRLTPDKPCVPIVSMAFSSDARYIATGTSSRLARIWDLQTGEVILTIGGHAESVSAIAFSRDGRRLVTSGSDGAIKIWDARNDHEFLTLDTHDEPVSCVAFSPDGRLAAAGSDNCRVRVWDTRTWRSLHTLDAHAGPVSCVAFDSTGARMLTAGQDGIAKIWTTLSGAMVGKLNSHDGAVTSASFSPDGLRILTTDSTSVQIWDAATGSRTGRLKGEPGDFRTALFSPDGERMLTAGKSIALWDAASGEKLQSIPAPDGQVRCAAFSPDGAAFITGDPSAGRIWNTADCTERWILRGHACSIACVCFSPDGKRVLTGSLGGAVLWNAETGRELLELTDHDGWVTSAAFSPDGRYLMTGGNDSTARLYLAIDWRKTIESFRSWKQETYRIWAQAQE